MGNIVFGLFIAIVGFVLGSLFKNTAKRSLSGIFKTVGLILGIVIIGLGCFATVPTGHTGILTTFGKVEDTTFEAGVHFKAPWQKVVCMDNRVQKITKEQSAFSSDIQEVDVLFTLNYRIDSSQAQNLYKTIGVNYATVIIEPRLSEAVKTITAKYTAEQLVEKRSELATGIEEFLTKELANFNIIVASTAVENMDFTDQFTQAVEAKQVAAQNKLKAQTEQEQATMEKEAAAKRQIIEAEAAAKVAQIQAQADLEVTKIQADAAEYAGQKEAAKNKAISEYLTKELINYYYIQQWNGELPSTYMGSDNVNTLVSLPDAK